MSPTDATMPGIKGKKVPGKPSRFDPSEPLHMRTRRAAKVGPGNGTPSINGSVEDDESRKGSMDDVRPVTSHSNGSQTSVRSRRPSEVSLPVAIPDVVMNGLPSSEEKNNSASGSKHLSPTLQSPSPYRKRKRSPSPTPPHQTIGSLQLPENAVYNSFESGAGSLEFALEDDTVELVPAQDLSDREVSQASSHSEEDLQNEDFAAQSMDITPAVSTPASPESSRSRSREDLPTEEPFIDGFEHLAPELQDEPADAIDEMDIDADGEGGDEVDDVDEQLRSDDDERPARRFGGRRRAQHPIPKVEKAMQRQAELKTAYRFMARALKPLLAEIAQRSVDDLEANPDLYTQTVEYTGVKKGLDEALEERVRRVQAQHELNFEQLRQTLEAEQRALKVRCKQQLLSLYESRVVKLKYETLKVARESQKHAIDAQDETDDENEVIPMPRAVGPRFALKGPIDNAYDSRSRLLLATERFTEDLDRRIQMSKLLNELDDDDKPERRNGFTVMDEAPRQAALARREGVEATKVLAKAAAAANIPTIRNEDAHGLQLLGDLASRPSITAALEPLPTKTNKETGSRQNQSRRMQPLLQIQTNTRATIPVEMSPRTTQAFGDRFESVMPPPVTPRNRTMPTMRSPEVTRAGQPLPSPTINANSFVGLQQFPGRTPNRRPESRRESFGELNRAPTDSQQRPESRHGPQFSPSVPNDRSTTFPMRREYSREMAGIPPGSAPSQRERPPFSLGLGLSLREDNNNGAEQRMQEAREVPNTIKSEPSPFGQLHGRPLQWRHRSSQSGLTDSQSQDQRSPTEQQARRPKMDAPSNPRSRNPSMSFKVQEFHPGSSQQKDSSQLPGHKPSKSIPFQNKTNKEERDGLSRRHWSNQRKFSKSIGLPDGSPTNATSAGSPSERTQPPSLWRGPPQPQHSPPALPHPPPTYQQSPYSQPPPPPIYRPAQQPLESYQHRNSFPARPASSTFDRLPPTPLYVVPQQQQQPQHPPPPGVTAEQFNRPFAPPPPPGYQPPPPPPPQPPTPQTPYPQSAPGSYANQFGGAPIAPAGIHPYHPFGPRQPPPAFAQQQQQAQQGSTGNRRRTLSDVSQFAKFHTWTPPTRR